MSFTKEDLVVALRNTFIGDSQTLKITTEYLAQASSLQGFCMSMMQLVDDATLPIQVKQAALVQLKNTIKLRWNTKKDELQSQQKSQIRGAILVAVTRCHRSYKLIKLYKEVFTIITNHDYKIWLPVQEIVTYINNDQEVVALIHILLAISASFEFSINDDQRNHFFQFLRLVLPSLQALVARRPQPQIIYLCIKFLWKAIHYQISKDIRQMACLWLPLVHAVIQAKNPLYDNSPQQFQQRQTQQFYYFHSKKWATRIVLRFLQKHAKRHQGFVKKDEDHKQFADMWYKTYGTTFINTLITQFSIKTTKKIRYFQFKSIQALIGQRPQLVKQYAEGFQYDVLLQYIRLTPQDQELANKNPVQYLTKQQQPAISFSNLKRVATDVWVAFSQMGQRIDKKDNSYQPGIYFYQNMNYLQQKLQQSNPIQKQLAMYLICQLRLPIMRCKQVKAAIPILIGKYVIPQFSNQIMFLRARAADIFYEYGTLPLQIDVVKKSAQAIYICLTKDPYPIVRVKAAVAFNSVLKHKQAKSMVQPLLKQILTIYLQLLDHYDLQNIVNSLQSIVEDFQQQIGPFASQLTKHLTKLFFKLFNKDAQQSHHDTYDGQAQLAAAGCLKTITRIIQSPVTKQAIMQIQPDIISILDFVFASDGIDYIEDSLTLLNAYLFKLPKISMVLLFFYQVIVYNISGIPKQMWEGLEKLPLPDRQKLILRSVKQAQNTEMIEQTTLVIRNYLYKCSLLGPEQPNYEMTKNNVIHLLFYLVSHIYKKPADSFINGQIDVVSAICCVIYLFQNFQKSVSENIINFSFEYVKANLNSNKFKSKLIKTVNSQLIGLLCWVAPVQVLGLAHKNNMLGNLIKQLTGYQSKYEYQHERVRVILGLTSILQLQQKPQQLLPFLPEIFKTVIYLVGKNADERIQEQINTKKENVSRKLDLDDEEDYEDENDDNQQIEFDDLDDDNFWQEQYDVNYTSRMDQIDQIQNFKRTMEKLSSSQPNIYQGLLQTVSQKDLFELNNKMIKAITYIQNNAKLNE